MTKKWYFAKKHNLEIVQKVYWMSAADRHRAGGGRDSLSPAHRPVRPDAKGRMKNRRRSERGIAADWRESYHNHRAAERSI
jgi:hypothetical protein